MDLSEIVKEYLIPIIGVFAGGGLSFHFDKSGGVNRRSDVNVENTTNITGNGNSVSNLNRIDNSRNITNNYGGGGNSRSSDGTEIIAIVCLGFVCIVASVYFYSVYAPEVYFFATRAMLGIGAFAIAFGVVGGLRGTRSWGHHAIYIALPLLLLGVGYWYCIPKLSAGYNPELAGYAKQYGAFKYFHELSSQWKVWIASQIIGVVCMLVAMALTLLFVVANSSRLKVGSLVISAGLLFLSAYGAEGNIHLPF